MINDYYDVREHALYNVRKPLLTAIYDFDGFGEFGEFSELINEVPRLGHCTPRIGLDIFTLCLCGLPMGLYTNQLKSIANKTSVTAPKITISR